MSLDEALRRNHHLKVMLGLTLKHFDPDGTWHRDNLPWEPWVFEEPMGEHARPAEEWIALSERGSD